MKLLLAALLLWSSPMMAQKFDPTDSNPHDTDINPRDVIHWQSIGGTQTQDAIVTADIRLQSSEGWRIYAHNIEFKGPSGFLIDSISKPSPEKTTDPMTGDLVDTYTGGEFTLRLAGTSPWQQPIFPVTVTYVGCTSVICLFPYSEEIQVILSPANDQPSAPQALPTPKSSSAQEPASPPAKTDRQNSQDLEQQLTTKIKSHQLSLASLLALVFLGGILSNLTPCVAPMIPITLRLLSRQGNKPVVAALAYSLGIVVSYSTLGIFASLSGGLFGSLLANKTFSAAFAGFMALLGFTMLGFGDFSKLQALGNRLGSGRPSILNTFMMGTGAGLVAAPCTGPILAALLAYSASNTTQSFQSFALLGVYSIGFALPYTFLGGFAASIVNIKVRPSLQLVVKFLFAGVMFGLAFYYLRVPFYGTLSELKPNWTRLTQIMAQLSTVVAGIFLFIPTLARYKAAQIIPALFLGITFFTLSQSLTTNSAATNLAGKVEWLKSEDEAFAIARATGKPILIDFWAEWCEACKKMDVTTFNSPEVEDLLGSKWVTLKLDLTESNDRNDAIQTRYGIQSLPTLMILPPDGDLSRKIPILGYISAAQLIDHLNHQ